MSEAEILNKVIELFSSMTDAEEVTADSEILDDLGISSMDVLVLISSMEEEFKIRVPEKRIRRLVTVGDAAEMIEELLN